MKFTVASYNSTYAPTWCPGCGNYAIWASLKNAMAKLQLDPEKTVIVYGIGCSGNMCNTINTYGFHGVHGRSLPVAEAVKLANHDLTVIAVLGDGDQYGEGMNHLIHSCRGNHNITCIVHDNEVYGLTTGQVSPTAEKGHASKSTPEGIIEVPVNPLAVALSSGATFVARSAAVRPQHLTDTIEKAIKHNGFSLIDVLQNCPSFNKYNTFEYYQERVYEMKDNNFKDKNAAFAKSWEWGKKIPIGVFYTEKRKSYEDELPQLASKTLVKREVKARSMKTYLGEYC